MSYFVALFEEGSVTRAAQRVHVVQPALSMQIAKLERELDQKLFERTPKAMEPTAAARTLYRLVQPILRDLAQAREQMARLSSTVSGRVRMGILSSLASSVIPNVLARFTTAYPEVEVSMADGYSATFIDWVNGGKLDLAIINKPTRKLGLLTHHLMDEEMVVVGGRETSLPVPIPVAMQDLLRLKLVLPSKRHGLRIELDRHLEAEGLALAPKLELDSPPGLADFVARSDWFTVLPSSRGQPSFAGRLAQGLSHRDAAYHAAACCDPSPAPTHECSRDPAAGRDRRGTRRNVATSTDAHHWA